MLVREAMRADVSTMTGLLGRAFDADPMMGWMFADTRCRRRVYPRMMAALISHTYLPGGGCQVAEVDGALVGAALWVPPDQPSGPKWRRVLEAPALISAFLAAGPARFLSLIRRGARLGVVIKAARPEQPHWYLAVLGTEPRAQGTGVGGALLRARLAECDRDGLPACLECSDANVPLYERFGFRVVGTIQVPEGGPVLRGMVRVPQLSE